MDSPVVPKMPRLPRTPGAGALSIQEMWEEASARFLQRTAKALKGQPPKSLDDLLAEVEKWQQEDGTAATSDARHTRTAKAKESARDVLRSIRVLGGIAAQGGDLVFDLLLWAMFSCES